ncbi:peptide-methionine (S)-S-oxide reductase MsrA [Arenicella xantha]|uniref:Peptide methionine sulfoxide reductase MsrA n=1 Tax=Arenicella xantha TaxID=644221 RepID=A0A395JM17_9GAMM|nr:peptide-methionine (S)-S-oxide reductase MsrA [Arenicella xantha]RBP50897.1 peptide-methionine (S)-S-oxide reductase [Arenicella xantha]
MKKQLFTIITLTVFALSSIPAQSGQTNSAENARSDVSKTVRTAVFAGGCFWCVESDFEKLNGVLSAVSGYTGGSAATANYKTVSYTETGHYEAVQVSYDPNQVSYSELVEFFWRHIDPTDPHGQFCDKGSSYKSAIFYADDSQKLVVEQSLQQLSANKPFTANIVTAIEAAKPFYLAEEYHQDYYKKNPIRYRIYRSRCGRDQRIEQLWGKQD